MCWYMVCVVSLGLWFWSSGFWSIVHWVDNLVSIVLLVVKIKAHFFFTDFFALRYILQLFQSQAKCEGLVRIFPTSSSCCKAWSRAGNIICECEEDKLSIYVQPHQSSLFLLCIVFLLQFCLLSLSLLYFLCSISSRLCCFAMCSRIDSCKRISSLLLPTLHSSNHFDDGTMLVLITKQYKSEFWCGFSVMSSQVVQKFFPVLFKKRAQAPAADKFCVNVSFLIRSAWHMQFQYFMSVEYVEHDCRASKLKNTEHAFCTQWGSFLASYVIVFVEHVVVN